MEGIDSKVEERTADRTDRPFMATRFLVPTHRWSSYSTSILLTKSIVKQWTRGSSTGCSRCGSVVRMGIQPREGYAFCRFTADSDSGAGCADPGNLGISRVVTDWVSGRLREKSALIRLRRIDQLNILSNSNSRGSRASLKTSRT